MKKRENIFFSKTCKNIKKRRPECRIGFLRQIWKKIFRPQKTNFFGQTKIKKEKEKTVLQSYTPCLNSQSIKRWKQKGWE